LSNVLVFNRFIFSSAALAARLFRRCCSRLGRSHPSVAALAAAAAALRALLWMVGATHEDVRRTGCR
jgi:hypothetical protein